MLIGNLSHLLAVFARIASSTSSNCDAITGLTKLRQIFLCIIYNNWDTLYKFATQHSLKFNTFILLSAIDQTPFNI